MIAETLEGVGGHLPAEKVRALCEEFDMGVDALMLELLPLAARFAVVPMSSFRVGAVTQGKAAGDGAPGALYLGANIEFTGQALAFTVHAEQAAVVNAWQHGEHGLTAIATSAAPCGHCRQFLHETVDSDALLMIEPPDDGSAVDAGPRKATLAELLPHAFGAKDLGIPGGLLDPRFEDRGLRLVGDAADADAVQGASGEAARGEDPVVGAALEAAQRSYVPYTGGRAGCAISNAAGQVFAGRYAESAAYNPSVSPLEAAVAFQVMNGARGEPFEIARAVLVESASLAGQRGATVAVLASLAPSVSLEYHLAESHLPFSE